MLKIPTIVNDNPAPQTDKKSVYDWTDSYKQNPNSFLDWFQNQLKSGRKFESNPALNRDVGWGNKNEGETADLMARELLPNLSLSDIQEKYKGIYGGQYYPTEWLSPQLTRATANEYRTGGYQGEAFNQFKNKVLGDLAVSSKGAQLNMARRGLGSGGMAQAEQAKLAAGASKDIAVGKQDISREAENLAQQVEANHLNSAIQQRNMKQQAYNTVYNSALQSYMQRKQASRQLASTAGAVAGYAALGPAGGMAGGYIGGSI